MGALVGIMLLIGLVLVLGQVVVGWLLESLIIAILLGFLFLKGALSSKAAVTDRLLFGSDAALWLLYAGLSQIAVRPLHAFLLFLVPAFATAAFGMTIWYPRSRWALNACLSWAILAWIPFVLLCWRDCRWIPDLVRLRDWTTYTTNEQLKVAGPVLVVRTDLSRQAWLERVLGVGRLPRISDIQGALRGNGRLPSALEPGQEKSVVLLVYGYNEVGRYFETGSAGGPRGSAYQNRCTITLLDRTARQRRVLGIALGPDPPSRTTAGSEYGGQPDDSDIESSLLVSLENDARQQDSGAGQR